MLQPCEMEGIDFLKSVPGLKAQISKEPVSKKEFLLYYEFNLAEDFSPNMENSDVIGLILKQLIPLHFKLKHGLETGTVVDCSVRLSTVANGSGIWFLKAFFYIEM
jgi:hypothetical protein